MSSIDLWTGSIVNQSITHSHIWINPKLANFVESKLSTWQDIADLNMNKRSTGNNQETIRTNVKGVKANYSQAEYGRIGH